jgi:uncharacterized membrane protein
MSVNNGRLDEKLKEAVSRILLFGVVLAALTVLVGGLLFLARHPHKTADYRDFNQAAPYARDLAGIARNVLALKSYGIIQLGLLLLIATPVARVAFSVAAFAAGKDVKYLLLTLAVLGVLLGSIAGFF